MNERTIFTEALDRESPAERSAYLDAACARDAALRGRVEALLRSHGEAGTFLGVPVPERLGGALAARETAGDPGTSPDRGDGGDGLDFLAPSDKPGVLGRLGHYEVLEVVGRGGMGVVLRAFDERLHRVVAVKVMAAELAASATARRRFTREARAAAAVAHDHVVTIHAVEEADPLPYIVMQYVSGSSLQARLDRGGPPRLHEVLRIGTQAALGLAAAHAQGLVHRDVKPANILLENGVERVRLTDFGLARAADDASLTQCGQVAGTPQYMSPEQAEGKPLDHRSDLFSLGSVLYAMCTGRPPFRAGTSMAVLRRVCEETPGPIRETNPEVPDWLTAVIGKMLAKDPAERFQSAAEVADLLGRHLAHLQHPTAAPPPAAPWSAAPSRAGQRRWAVAAAAAAVLVAGLGATEATGVTTLRAAVTRALTPDGTLAVEADDPDVTVTIEGDGGLVVTRAGPREVRLRPGGYRVRADKDGKWVPLERELVSIAPGGREVVKVKLETPPVMAAGTAEKGAFVLLAGGQERKFDTLAEAVRNAGAGDAIEIRGAGPFVGEPIPVRCGLTIRAGAGAHPVIRLSAERGQADRPLLEAWAPLVLEGLELQRLALVGKPREWHPLVAIQEVGSLHAANCRFVMGNQGGLWGGGLRTLRNCEFVTGTDSAAIHYGKPPPDSRCTIENCCLAGALCFRYPGPHVRNVTLELNRSSLLGGIPTLLFLVDAANVPRGAQGELTTPPIRVHASENVLDVGPGNAVFHSDYQKPVERGRFDALLTGLVKWGERNNLYPKGAVLIRSSIQWGQHTEAPVKNLADWNRFWGVGNTGSTQGTVRFQGGDLRAKAQAGLGQVTAADFRLRPDSAGYRAGRDGKDLGADVDFVGPGAAYERWKKTSEYRKWLADTGQTR